MNSFRQITPNRSIFVKSIFNSVDYFYLFIQQIFSKCLLWARNQKYSSKQAAPLWNLQCSEGYEYIKMQSQPEKITARGWRCGSLVKWLPSMHEACLLWSSAQKREKKDKTKGGEEEEGRGSRGEENNGGILGKYGFYWSFKEGRAIGIVFQIMCKYMNQIIPKNYQEIWVRPHNQRKK